MNWFKKLFSEKAGRLEHALLIENRLLREELMKACQELQEVRYQRNTASAAQAALHRRAESLKKDRPDLWDSYFTKAGEAARLLKQTQNQSKVALKEEVVA